MRIKAAVLNAPDAPYVIEDVELPDPGPREVRVRIVGTGMCHTDLMPRAPQGLVPTPIVLGHEGAGVVDAVGSAVRSVVPGDHVVLSFDSCGDCVTCLAGQPAYCDDFLPLNMGARWFGQSSFASYAIATERNTVKVDPALPLEKLGPLGCGIQTGAGAVLNSLGVRAGDSIAVYGTGAVGLAAVMAARVAGATTIIAVDLNEKRLALATELGATHTFTGATVEQIRGIVPGGVRYAVDTTGVPAVVSTAVSALRPGGVCGLVGLPTGPYVLDGSELLFGRTVMGIIEGGAVPQKFIPELIELWRQGRFPFDRLITTYALADINDAERDSLAGDVVKPVLIP